MNIQVQNGNAMQITDGDTKRNPEIHQLQKGHGTHVSHPLVKRLALHIFFYNVQCLAVFFQVVNQRNPGMSDLFQEHGLRIIALVVLPVLGDYFNRPEHLQSLMFRQIYAAVSPLSQNPFYMIPI